MAVLVQRVRLHEALVQQPLGLELDVQQELVQRQEQELEGLLR